MLSNKAYHSGLCSVSSSRVAYAHLHFSQYGHFMTFAWCLQVDHCTSGLGFSFGPKNCGWFFLRNTARLSRNPSASSTSIWVFALKQASCQRNVTFPKLLCLDLFLSEALTRRQRFETRRATRNDDVSNKSASNIKEGMSQLEIITMTTANKLLH